MEKATCAFRKCAMALIAVFAFSAAGAATVERVIVRQQWPWHGLVRVEYRLRDVTSPVDIAVSLSVKGEQVAADPGAFSGALFAVSSAGVYSFTIDPAKTGLSSVARADDLTVALSAVPASESSLFPLYRIYDLKTGACENVTAGEIASGLRGSWCMADTNGARLVARFVNAAAITNIIWTGVNSNSAYKTTKLAMRYLPSGTVNLLNRRDKQGTIGHDFYIGVYEVTQKQWELIYGTPAECSWVSDTKPVNTVTYDSIRGADSTNYWSAMVGGNLPHPDSFLGKLRKLTGGVAFDLPTRAMCDYATQVNSLWRFTNDAFTVSGCEDGAWNDDSPFENIPLNKSSTDANLPGTYAGNAGSAGPAQVGSYACNKVGIYDTIGNVREWCVDWHDSGMKQSDYTSCGGAANVDPENPALIWKNSSGNTAVSMRYRAGSAYNTSLLAGITPNYFNSGVAGCSPSESAQDTGLRVVVVIGE